MSKQGDPIAHSPALRWGSVAVFIIAVGLVVFLAIRRSNHVSDERARLKEQRAEGFLVKTIHVRESPPFSDLRLIGDVRPYADVTLYAKVSGYMRNISVDKGDRVQKGQLLAIIESPETDKAYNGALATAINTGRIAARYRVLERRGLVSHQEAQQAYTNSDVAKSELQTDAILKSYERVVAPFDGTITNRFVDPGQMIQNGANSAGALALVSVADLDRVRVYCYVNQGDAPFVHPGDPVVMKLRERPNIDFRGQITRISGALDPKTRMMLAETDFSNRDRLIVPGSYSEVWMRIPKPKLMIVPTESLVMKGTRDFVVVVTKDRRAAFTPIRLADNNGLEIEIAQGVKPGDEVVVNPPEELSPGMPLQPRATDAPPKGQGNVIERAGRAGQAPKPLGGMHGQ